jgi:hypothetical protein
MFLTEPRALLISFGRRVDVKIVERFFLDDVRMVMRLSVVAAQ